MNIKKPRNLFIFFALFALFVLWLISSIHWFGLFYGSNDSYTQIGQFGDSFGYWNSIFSGVALILVITSVHLQAKELAHVSRTFRKDSFERTFFNMINLYNQQREQIGTDKHPTSSRFTEYVLESIKKTQMDTIGGNYANLHNGQRDDVLEQFINQNGRNKKYITAIGALPDHLAAETFGAYLQAAKFSTHVERLLNATTRTLSFICTEVERVNTDEAGVKDERNRDREIAKYTNIFWSQLTDQEIEFLMIYAYAMRIGKGFKINRYFINYPPEVETFQRIMESHFFLVEHFEQN